MTLPSLVSKMNVCCGIVRIAVRARADDLPGRALAAVFDDHAPLRIVVAANTPRPWMAELRTRYGFFGGDSCHRRWASRECGREAARREREFYPMRGAHAALRRADRERRAARRANRRWRRSRSWKRNSSPPLARISRTRLRLSGAGQPARPGDLRDERRQRREGALLRPPASGVGPRRRARGRRCAVAACCAAARSPPNRAPIHAVTRSLRSARSRPRAPDRGEARCRSP